jgi:hypothetical protein
VQVSVTVHNPALNPLMLNVETLLVVVAGVNVAALWSFGFVIVYEWVTERAALE